jgi:hypothetical protein
MANRHNAQRRGGYARAAALSPERRREIAREAAQARWAQRRENNEAANLRTAGHIVVIDQRPINCRFRLRDEGKAHPRSACVGCGKSISTGLGTHCHIPFMEVFQVEVQPSELPPFPAPLSDEALFARAAMALSDARRLWPARHPAAGLIMGVEDDSRRVYEMMGAVIEDLTQRLTRKDSDA